MIENIKKHQRSLLVGLIIICVLAIPIGGIRYLRKLQNNLKNEKKQDVMDMTLQKTMAFDNFISEDQARLHSYAEYFTTSPTITKEEFQEQLKMFKKEDSVLAVICLQDGWYINNAFEEILQVDEENLNELRALSGSGIRDNYIGLFTDVPRFCYYETFTFHDGHNGIIQKSYDRSRVLEAFPLSFYNGEGSGYILEEKGDILLRSDETDRNRAYQNVFDALIDTHVRQKDIDALREALEAREAGSIIFTGDYGSLLYTFAPLTSVEDWYMLSVVPVEAIREDADRMLRDSLTMLGGTLLLLFICAVLILLVRRTNKDIEAKDQEVRYQSQLFDIFTNYLAVNTDDMYIMVDHKTEELEYISPNVERVLGVSAEEAMDYIWDSDMAADVKGTETYYAKLQAMTPGNPMSRNTERINPKNGERRFFVENAYCVDIQGKIKRVAYISDRTKDQKIQESLFEALQMAQSANNAKSSFMSNISHDIRTPMNAIIGFLSLIQNEADNPDAVREYTQRIDAASQHLLGLINDVLDMNKIESGSATLNITEVDLATLVDEINTIIRPQARAKDQTFDIFVGHLKYEHLLGDKLRINQILINLLSNAVKYTQKNGSIIMRVKELPQVVDNYSRIRITVSDNGLGMSEDYLKVIFDPFTREETKSTYGIQGTGLGMAITKSLVDLMSGTIHVESELEKGSTFTLELELRIQEREDDPRFWTDHSVARMIVADDEEEVCLSIVRNMAQTGVTCDYATDGETAIRMMRGNREAGRPYDIILLDWKMPGLDGLETARLIRKNYPEKIPILLLTAYDWGEIEQEAREIGVNHFLPKPFFMSIFKTAIRRVMGNSKKAESQENDDVVRGMNILVVDDIEVNRLILVKILNTMGAVCDTASNGQEALEKFEASKPGTYDLILMDVQMPVMDGYTATRAIRSSSHPSARSLPIIAMTANAFVDDVRDAIDSGMDAHIAKPVQIDNLKTVIRQVLDDRLQYFIGLDAVQRSARPREQ